MKSQRLLWLCGEGACPQTYEHRIEKEIHADTARIGRKHGKKLASNGKVSTYGNGFIKQGGKKTHAAYVQRPAGWKLPDRYSPEFCGSFRIIYVHVVLSDRNKDNPS